MQASDFKVGWRVRIIPSKNTTLGNRIGTVTKADEYNGLIIDLGEEGNLWFAPREVEVIAPKLPTVASDLRLTPQAKTVLGHLKRHGRISPAEADRVYGYTRLASCIHEIRHKAGYAVRTELRRDDHGGKYAKYTLAVN